MELIQCVCNIVCHIFPGTQNIFQVTQETVCPCTQVINCFNGIIHIIFCPVYQIVRAFSGFIGHSGNIIQTERNVIHRGFRVVQHAVHKTGNGGHGRFQLVADVGHKLPAADFRLLQGGGHVVELGGQLVHLHGAALVHLGTGPQVAVAEAVGRVGQVLELLGLMAGQDGRGRHRHQQHHAGRDQENLQHGADDLRRVGGRGRSHHDADALAGGVGGNRRGDVVPLLGIEAAESALGIGFAGLQHLGRQTGQLLP